MKMVLDFPSILGIATIVTGLIWLVDSLFFKKKRKLKQQSEPLLVGQKSKYKEPMLVDYAKSFFPVLLAVFVLRAFIVEPFRIPSGSMKPTLLEGDFILVNKFSYDLRMPLWGNSIIKTGEPQRGDITVFRFPKDPNIDFIKRIVGLPGDKISYKDKTLFLNGEKVPQEFLENNIDLDGGYSIPVKQYKEKLPSKEHSIYLQPYRTSENLTELVVPEGSYFVLGDNRDNSKDSREWGLVPKDYIIGKAVYILMSWDGAKNDIRWHRVGNKIQ